MAANYFVGADIIGDDDELDSVFSGEEIIGDDEDDEMDFSGDSVFGAEVRKLARKAKTRTQQQMLARLLHAQNIPSGTKIVRDNLKILRVQVLPLPVTAILAGQTEDVVAAPQRPIRVERLVVPSFVAEYFTITQFSVGQENQFVESGEISCQSFSEVAVGSRLQGNTASIGNRINLSVKNIDAADQTFYGSISGSVLTNG